MNEWKMWETIFSLTPQRKIGNVSSNIPTLSFRDWKCECKDYSQNSSDDVGENSIYLGKFLVFSH